MNTAKMAGAALAVVLVLTAFTMLYDWQGSVDHPIPTAPPTCPTPIDILKQAYGESSFAMAYVTPSDEVVVAYAGRYDSVEAT